MPSTPIERVGLTGSIATGKSLAASYFAELGIPVIDADVLARKVVEPGTPALSEIEKRFGPGVILPDGTLDRAALGKIIFADEKARLDLNKIVHPRVALEAEREFSRHLAAHPGSFVVYNVPLLYETGMEPLFDFVVVVASNPGSQLERLAARDGIDAAEARRKIATQIEVSKKTAMADAVLENDGTREDLRAKVVELAALLREHNGATLKKT